MRAWQVYSYHSVTRFPGVTRLTTVHARVSLAAVEILPVLEYIPYSIASVCRPVCRLVFRRIVLGLKSPSRDLRPDARATLGTLEEGMEFGTMG